MNTIRSYQGIEPQIDDNAWIDDTAVIIGHVHIAQQVSIWPQVVVRGDIHRIEIGAGTNIQDGCIVHVSHDSRFLPGGAPTIIHEHVTVGHQAVLHGCEIHAECLIGIGAKILDRAILKPHCMLAAGALVPPGQVLEGGYLYVGTPAKRTRILTDLELEYFNYTAEHYIQLAMRHRATVL
jgi:carbonic anhydrase/acetyltransferase-like protein (isoleucine patch superfamily)